MHPRLHRRVLMALRSFLRRRTVDQELDEELRFHLEQMEELRCRAEMTRLMHGGERAAKWGAWIK